MNYKLSDGTLTIFLEGRIDSGNASDIEKELFSIISEKQDQVIMLDTEKLDYISSAGLRILMKICKQSKAPVKVLNVSSDIYEIFDTTGFTELMDVRKAYRKISIEGLKQIGEGATAKVYRLDRDTIVKVFSPNVSPDIIKRENEHSRNAFVIGIPTAISFDIVRVGDSYGTVYELLDAEDLLTVLENDKEHIREYIIKLAETMKKMNSVEVDPQKFTPAKQVSIALLPKLKNICTDEEIAKLRSLYESIPDRNTFIHGDCHPGNVMIRNGEMMFIDLMTCGCGHPIFDLASMCVTYFFSHRSEESRKKSILLRNFTLDEVKLIWNTYLTTYLGTNDEEILKKAVTQISALTASRMLFATIQIPGLFNEEQIKVFKNIALSYVDNGIEPICF